MRAEQVGGIAAVTAGEAHNDELALQNAELLARLHLMEDAIENVRHGLCVFDAEGRIALCNSRYSQVIGLDPEQVKPGMPAREIIKLAHDAGYYGSDRSIDDIEREFWRNLDEDNTQPGEIRRLGKTHVIHPGRTAEGNLVATFEDITPQILAEAALRESEARMRDILDALPVCVVIFDTNAEPTYINPAGLRLIEAPDLETLVESGFRPIPEDQLPACFAAHERVLQGESVFLNYHSLGMKGGRRYVEAHGVPFRMPDGSPGHLNITRDITDHKKAEDALRDSEERLRLVQDAMELADFENRCTEITTCSDRFFEQVGLPVGDGTINIWDWMKLVHPDDRQRVQDEMEEALDEADLFDSEYRVIRADNGETRWVSCRTRLLRDENGKAVRTIGSHRDITDRKKSEIALQESERRLRLVQEATGLAEFWTEKGGVVHVSERMVEQLGLPEATKTVPFNELMQTVHPDDRANVEHQVHTSIASAGKLDQEYRIIHGRTGEVRWIHSRIVIDRDAEGNAIRTIGGHLDITDRKRAEAALRDSEERFRLAAEAAGFGVWDYDPATDQRRWSNRLLEILGLAEDTQPSIEQAAECIHPDHRQAFLDLLQAARNGEAAEGFEDTYRIIRASDGEERWVAFNGWLSRASDDRVNRIIVTLRDVTEERTAEDRIRWAATHDALTGLSNRAHFQERLDETIIAGAEDGKPGGLLLLDLDHFKQINDSLGHDAGDQLLRKFAALLETLVRPDDMVARLGGDEFAIIMPQLGRPEELASLSESIHQQLYAPFVYRGRALDCNASIGVALFPEHGENSTDLIKHADMALYAAKNAGRANTTVYEPKLRDEIERRTNMVQLARDALGDNRIDPYYQPKLDLRSRKIIGFEALLRWHGPDGTLRLPDALAAAFDDLDVAAALSRRMIERAISDMRGWLNRGIDFGHVAVNTCAADFRRGDFADWVLNKLKQAEIPTACFQIEVTETVFLGQGAEYVQEALARFSAAGVKIALDDFGTGYASLRHLKEFPVDIIKIDRSFVSDMAADHGNDAIVRAVINLGRSLSIGLVAEGVEKESQAERLQLYGCEIGQGFLFARARPAAEVPGLVASAFGALPCKDHSPDVPHRRVAG